MHRWKSILQPVEAQRDRLAGLAIGSRTALHVQKYAPLWRRYWMGKHQKETLRTAMFDLIAMGVRFIRSYEWQLGQ